MDVVAAIQKNKESSENIIDHDFIVRYYPESDKAKVPFKVTSGSAGYDLYAAEEKNILPKIFSRSGLFLNHLVTAEGGVIIKVVTLITEELSK